jgi:restriction system protein
LLAAGIVPFALGCLLGLLLFHGAIPTLLLGTGAYFFGVALTAVAPYLLPDWIERRPGEVAGRLQEARRRKGDASLELARAEQHLDDVLQQDRARRAYEEANASYQKMLEAHRARKAQLLQTDWRSLRDVEFEAFLAEVFRELGYRVETTKRTGDQGVDLIVSRDHRRVAVQTKGYKDSVGNKAVQEVVAGRLYYQCDGCAAVTNSTFTTGARDLASATDCLLIEGRDIPNLIRGDVVL